MSPPTSLRESNKSPLSPSEPLLSGGVVRRVGAGSVVRGPAGATAAGDVVVLTGAPVVAAVGGLVVSSRRGLFSAHSQVAVVMPSFGWLPPSFGWLASVCGLTGRCTAS